VRRVIDAHHWRLTVVDALRCQADAFVQHGALAFLPFAQASGRHLAAVLLQS
jgi:hypothetical protein